MNLVETTIPLGVSDKSLVQFIQCVYGLTIIEAVSIASGERVVLYRSGPWIERVR